MPRDKREAAQPFTFERPISPISVRPEMAAAYAGISLGSLNKLFKAGKISAPVTPADLPNVRLLNFEKFKTEWLVHLEECENVAKDSWADA